MGLVSYLPPVRGIILPDAKLSDRPRQLRRAKSEGVLATLHIDTLLHRSARLVRGRARARGETRGSGASARRGESAFWDYVEEKRREELRALAEAQAAAERAAEEEEESWPSGEEGEATALRRMPNLAPLPSVAIAGAGAAPEADAPPSPRRRALESRLRRHREWARGKAAAARAALPLAPLNPTGEEEAEEAGPPPDERRRDFWVHKFAGYELIAEGLPEDEGVVDSFLHAGRPGPALPRGAHRPSLPVLPVLVPPALLPGDAARALSRQRELVRELAAGRLPPRVDPADLAYDASVFSHPLLAPHGLDLAAGPPPLALPLPPAQAGEDALNESGALLLGTGTARSEGPEAATARASAPGSKEELDEEGFPSADFAESWEGVLSNLSGDLLRRVQQEALRDRLARNLRRLLHRHYQRLREVFAFYAVLHDGADAEVRPPPRLESPTRVPSVGHERRTSLTGQAPHAGARRPSLSVPPPGPAERRGSLGGQPPSSSRRASLTGRRPSLSPAPEAAPAPAPAPPPPPPPAHTEEEEAMYFASTVNKAEMRSFMRDCRIPVVSLGLLDAIMVQAARVYFDDGSLARDANPATVELFLHEWLAALVRLGEAAYGRTVHAGLVERTRKLLEADVLPRARKWGDKRSVREEIEQPAVRRLLGQHRSLIQRLYAKYAASETSEPGDATTLDTINPREFGAFLRDSGLWAGEAAARAAFAASLRHLDEAAAGPSGRRGSVLAGPGPGGVAGRRASLLAIGRSASAAFGEEMTFPEFEEALCRVALDRFALPANSVVAPRGPRHSDSPLGLPRAASALGPLPEAHVAPRPDAEPPPDPGGGLTLALPHPA
eukprot:tig00021127_g18815.t1